ncbi:transaldolase [Pelagibacteraceae bacterium]|nr:transaldolase [Pelagibacteraceae bacterium]
MESNIINDLSVQIYADGASIDQISNQNNISWVKGFTTNPTLMKKNGIKNYKKFALDVMEIVNNKPVSFEVFSDDLYEMLDQAHEISSWNKNINVKIPITNTKGEYTLKIIENLNNSKIKCNVTALFSIDQVRKVLEIINDETFTIISIFAGRIADTGINPEVIISEAVDLVKQKNNIKILWASPRELYNIFQADKLGCDIITVAEDILSKISNVGKDLNEFSLETVKMFYNDALSSNFKIDLKK